VEILTYVTFIAFFGCLWATYR